MLTSLSEPAAEQGGREQDRIFQLLHPKLQSLIREQLRWSKLRPIQIRAIEPILAGKRDTLIVAGTASGKTEAAWFPIFSSALSRPAPGLVALCITPLKALVDDQVTRLARYGRQLDLRVEGWHGDIASSRKAKFLIEPPMGLMITPESLQGILLHRRDELRAAVSQLRYFVVDEVHSFAGTDRGQQVQSLLHQVEDLAGHRVSRVALSATVSAPSLVAEFLRPGAGPAVLEIKVPALASDIDVRLFGFDIAPADVPRGSLADALTSGTSTRHVATRDRLEIAREIDKVTRGRRALVFAGSRAGVEEMTTLLADAEVTGTGRPERFFPHHGSLSREVRRTAESKMHDVHDAVTICTSTLELGVDLPELDLVVQIDACQSVASLRQRLGRSGRQESGSPPTLRAYCAESPASDGAAGGLRAALVQTIAAIELMRVHQWVEPPDLAPLGLSTLVHQVLCVVHNTTGTTAPRAFQLLCDRGPWRRVTSRQFAEVLRSLADHKLIRQESSGLLFLDEAGHQLVARRDFLAVFTTLAEYTVKYNGKELGKLPVSYPLGIGSALVFAGRTWIVTGVHGGGWAVEVQPHDSGLPPKFKGGYGRVHARVRQEMRLAYLSEEMPAYLDEKSASMLTAARDAFRARGLDRAMIVNRPDGGGSLLALWTGDRQLETVRRWIEVRHPGTTAVPVGVGLALPSSVDETTALVSRLVDEEPPSAEHLAEGVLGKVVGKFDDRLREQLKTLNYASTMFDMIGARDALEAAAEGRS